MRVGLFSYLDRFSSQTKGNGEMTMKSSEMATIQFPSFHLIMDKFAEQSVTRAGLRSDASIHITNRESNMETTIHI